MTGITGSAAGTAEAGSAQPAVPSQTLHVCPGGRLGIVSTEQGRRLIALRPFSAGQLVLRIDGDLAHQPSRHSVQIDHSLHIAPAADPPGQHPLDHGFWRYLNHSCEPNAALNGPALFALRDIPAGADVGFDYNCTEWDMAAPFACHCGSARCLGTVRSYAHLSAEQRALRPDAAPHLTARRPATRP